MTIHFSPTARRVEIHAEARDAHGRSVRDTGLFSDMYQYADVRTVEAAHEWAARTFARDARVTSVDLRESVFDGFTWVAGAYLGSIARTA